MNNKEDMLDEEYWEPLIKWLEVNDPEEKTYCAHCALTHYFTLTPDGPDHYNRVRFLKKKEALIAKSPFVEKVQRYLAWAGGLRG